MNIYLGKKYRLMNTGKGKMKVKGKVIKEYKHFYLFDCGKYRTTVMKCDLSTGDYLIEEVRA